MSLKYEVYYNSNAGYIGYYRHESYHRIGAPALIYENRGMFWYEYGDSHRLDGPSDTYAKGTLYYFIRGTQYTVDEYELKIRG